MDIDFHYHATYVAARFAGYTDQEALVIGTSAQMIDEAARDVLVTSGKPGDWSLQVTACPNEFEIRDSATGATVHTYRPLMSFQKKGDVGSSAADTLASIWPVFHFMPGNFDPSEGNALPAIERKLPHKYARHAKGSRLTCRSHRWIKRTYSGESHKSLFQGVEGAREKSKWLTRPHSPMAIALINNTTDLVHTPDNEIAKHGLAHHLAGVTMHVFIDTWAHQDFVGQASASMNDAGNFRVGFLPRTAAFPTLEGTTKPAGDSLGVTFEDGDHGFLGRSVGVPGEEKNLYVGHGRVGVWPDHSALVWEYQPAWQEAPLIRVNPHEYVDAFAHMVWALYCIKNNLQYEPFDITAASIAKLCTHIGGVEPRDFQRAFDIIADGAGRAASKKDDVWDDSVRDVAGRKWIAFATERFPGEAVTTDWVPGASDWVNQVVEVYLANKKQEGARRGDWLTIEQFGRLDYFKFNLAAKHHYRFVKFTLMAFGLKLIGDWPDGSASADDLSNIARAGAQGWYGELMQALDEVQRKTTNGELNIGMKVLADEIALGVQSLAMSEVERIDAVLARLRGVETAVATQAAWSYGILDKDGDITSSTVRLTGADALKRVKKFIARLEELRPQAATEGRTAIFEPRAEGGDAGVSQLISLEDWIKASYVLFARRASDKELVAIDSAYTSLLRLVPQRALSAKEKPAHAAARRVVGACDAWLVAGRGDQARRPAITALRASVMAGLPGA